jgi:hypothetical protein
MIDRAFNDGTILRTHVMRPTWHFVTPDDILWLLDLTAPRVRVLMTYYDRELEIDETLRRKSTKVLSNKLRNNAYMTREEISRALSTAGIDAKGQRLGHIVMHAELDGLVCSGPLRGKKFTYALLSERAPGGRTLTREEALAELTLRFFSGHGPATAKDLAWWSGLAQAEAKIGLDLARSSLSSAKVNDDTYYFTGRQTSRRAAGPIVRLLPNYDEYLVGYRSRNLFLDRSVVPPIRNDALAAHFVVVDGQVAGGWRRNVTRDGVAVRLTLFGRNARASRTAIDAEFHRYANFVGAPVSVTVEAD